MNSLYDTFMLRLQNLVHKYENEMTRYETIFEPEDEWEYKNALHSYTWYSDAYKYFMGKASSLESITIEEVANKYSLAKKEYEKVNEFSKYMFGDDDKALCNRYPKMWDEVESVRYELLNTSNYWSVFKEYTEGGIE